MHALTIDLELTYYYHSSMPPRIMFSIRKSVPPQNPFQSIQGVRMPAPMSGQPVDVPAESIQENVKIFLNETIDKIIQKENARDPSLSTQNISNVANS